MGWGIVGQWHVWAGHCGSVWHVIGYLGDSAGLAGWQAHRWPHTLCDENSGGGGGVF